MPPPTPWTLRTWLYLMAGAIVAPMTLLIGYNITQQYVVGQEVARDEAFRLAQLTADTAGSFIMDAHGVLTTLARRPQMPAALSAGRDQCDPIFRNFKEFYPQLSNMSLSTPDGFLVCSSLPQPDDKPLPVAHMAWFKQVYQRQAFVVGPIVFGPINSNWISVLAEPVRDRNGKMIGALQTPIDLLKFRLVPAAERLPLEMYVVIFDSEGNVVARSREAENYVGKNLSGKSSIVDIAIRQRQGALQSVGEDGVSRLYGFTPVAGTDWIAMAGIDTDFALASARRNALTSALLGGGIVVLVLMLALWLSRRIGQPIQAVSDAARKVGAGHLEVRVPIDGPREVVDVAQQFNAMLDAIEDAQARILHSEGRLKLALEGSGTAIWDMDLRNGTIYLSETWSELIDGPSVATHTTPRAFMRRLPAQDRTLVTAAFRQVLRTGTDDFVAEHRVRKLSGDLVWIMTQGSVTERDADGRATRLLGVIRDVSERRRREAEIHRLAYFDPLTGLPNRRLLPQELVQALSQARRSDLCGALMFIDLDRFKSINDARGHETGDALLKAVAQRLRSTIRAGDLVARMGGDEFVVLMTGISDDASAGARSAHVLAEKIREALEQPYELDKQTFTSSASIGIALFPHDNQSSDDLLREADIAMYRAKAAGRNQIAFFEARMQDEVEQRLALENDLSKAIARQQLSVHVQSQVDAAGVRVGAELLLRWQHPDHGMVPPSQFIDIAEESGLILQIGDWVLQQACLLEASLRAAGRSIPLSINVSPRQFRQPGFVERVKAVLQVNDTPATSLIFEVTENLLLDNMDATIGRMNELNALGIRFSVDDFGTGYSSLGYLKRLPLYELKIDRSFVQGTPDDHDDAEIVQMIISLAKLLQLRVVAEGVETPEQARFLSGCGCDALQGYLNGRPVPATEWLAA